MNAAFWICTLVMVENNSWKQVFKREVDKIIGKLWKNIWSPKINYGRSEV